MIRNLLILTALCIIVHGSEHVNSQSCYISSEASTLLHNPTDFVSEPHEYFPAQIRDIVDAANRISPDAIELPNNHSYPVIDISSWMNPSASNTEDRQHVVEQVLAEAISSGSFNFIGHGIEDALFDRLYSSADSFFSMSLEQKMLYHTGKNIVGYVADRTESVDSVYKSGNSKEQKDLRESYNMLYPPSSEGNFTGPSGFQDAMVEFTDHLLTVEVVLKQIFTAALSSAKGIELPTTYLKDVEEDTTGQLRVSRYTNTPGFEDAIKLLPHSDWGTLTIINSADEGLEEVRDGRWCKVPAKKGELHVNVGEMYAMWSNGLFKNNIHRVSSEAAMDRISFGYFTSQGTLTSNAGINPICSTGEESKFPRASTKSHVMHYMNKLTGSKI